MRVRLLMDVDKVEMFWFKRGGSKVVRNFMGAIVLHPWIVGNWVSEIQIENALSCGYGNERAVGNACVRMALRGLQNILDSEVKMGNVLVEYGTHTYTAAEVYVGNLYGPGIYDGGKYSGRVCVVFNACGLMKYACIGVGSDLTVEKLKVLP